MKCPKCKNEEKFYVEVKVKGNTVEYYDSEGNYLYDDSNSGFYVDMYLTHGKYFYCAMCETRVEKFKNLEESQ